MTKIKWLVAIFVATFVYVLLSIVVGKNGIMAYNQLQEQKIQISRQTSLIQKINTELLLEKTALEKDKDVIAAFARKLDYVKDGERLVKITGLRPYQSLIYDTGTVLKRKSVSYLDEKFCKGSALAFFALFVLLFTFSGDKKKSEKSATVKKIPLYDVAQV